MLFKTRKKKLKYYAYETNSFIVVLIAVLVMIGYMMWPFVAAFIFAAIISGAFYPLFNRILKKTGWSRSAVAAVVCLIIITSIFLPSIYIIVRLSKEIMGVYSNLHVALSQDTLNDIFFGDHYFAHATAQVFRFFNIEYSLKHMEELIVGGLRSISLSAFQSINSLIGNLVSFLFQLLVMLIALFALFTDGPKLKKFLLALSPLKDEDEELIVKQFNHMNYVTLVYNGIGGVIQGVLGGIAFAILGFQSVLLWTTLMVILAFIPLLGISIVYIPACLYLAFRGDLWSAAGLFVYCTFVALVTENWFKPKFMGRHVQINSYLVFFSILGGMSVFGMAGIFYGPLVVAIFLTIAKLYLTKYEKLLQTDD